ncbi:heme ABC exporter ATP-binding protein CcmA [candidate division KSB1 bacterium]|nr:heme ABC exporter ATP-binding protein CcmA [candidate division KSB1 bacterium]
MITAQNIRKSFGHAHALKGVNFHIKKGEYVSLLGINGAGKTTLIRIISALTKPTEGNIIVSGVPLKKNPNLIRRLIGVMSHFTFLYGDMSAEENLKFYGNMYNVPDLHDKIDQLLVKVNLNTRRYDLVRTFSRGMQQRLSLARAILHDPHILLLDEPFAGLDVNAEKLLTDLIHDYVSGGMTILLTTHDINYALRHSQRIFVLKEGELVKDDVSGALTRNEIAELLSV